MVRISNTLVAGISALAMAEAVVLPTTAARRARRGFMAAAFTARGAGGRGVWHGAIGAAVTGRAAGGALRSPRACWPAPRSQAIPYRGGGYGDGGYGYGGGCWQVRPIYDAYDNYLGQQSVNVCQ